MKFYVNPLSVHPLNEVESLSRNLVELEESGCFGGNSLPHKLIMWKFIRVLRYGAGDGYSIHMLPDPRACRLPCP